MSYYPLLAIITGIFEFAGAIFAFVSAGRKRILYPVGLILLLLAGYQFAEVAVCAQPENLIFARVALFDITWLPVLGIWLVYLLANPKRKWLISVPILYFTAGLVFSLWILLDASSITKSVCHIVIARYTTLNPFETTYGVFYQLGLAIAVFGAAASMVYAQDSVARKHLANVQTGILGFMLPSFIVRLLVSDPGGILPSVMCHFALILAVSLCVLVVRERRSSLSTAQE